MPERTAELITPRLRLRRPRPDDVQAIHAIMSDPESMRYWSSLPHASLGETAQWFDGMLAADRAGESDEYVIDYRGEVIGKLGAWRLPEIGFFIHRDHWGKGIASEALAAYVAYVREEGVPALLADVDPRNAACLALLRKAGFEESGRASATYTIGGRVCDSVYLRLELQPRP